jgi:hypothetical protein
MSGTSASDPQATNDVTEQGYSGSDTERNPDKYMVIRVPQVRPDGSIVMVDIRVFTPVDQAGSQFDLSGLAVQSLLMALIREVRELRRAYCDATQRPFQDGADQGQPFRSGISQ